MNIIEKIRDNFIPIEKLYNKFFYSEKVASLLLKKPLNEIGQDTALVLFLSPEISKSKLLKLYKKQNTLILKITRSLDQFKVYDASSKKYFQPMKINYGTGIEYLILGEILERDFKFNFNYTPEEVYMDKGLKLCSNIEIVLNRIGDYFRDKNSKTLKSIRNLISENIKNERLERLDDK